MEKSSGFPGALGPSPGSLPIKPRRLIFPRGSHGSSGPPRPRGGPACACPRLTVSSCHAADLAHCAHICEVSQDRRVPSMGSRDLCLGWGIRDPWVVPPAPAHRVRSPVCPESQVTPRSPGQHGAATRPPQSWSWILLQNSHILGLACISHSPPRLSPQLSPACRMVGLAMSLPGHLWIL